METSRAGRIVSHRVFVVFVFYSPGRPTDRPAPTRPDAPGARPAASSHATARRPLARDDTTKRKIKHAFVPLARARETRSVARVASSIHPIIGRPRPNCDAYICTTSPSPSRASSSFCSSHLSTSTLNVFSCGAMTAEIVGRGGRVACTGAFCRHHSTRPRGRLDSTDGMRALTHRPVLTRPAGPTTNGREGTDGRPMTTRTVATVHTVKRSSTDRNSSRGGRGIYRQCPTDPWVVFCGLCTV